MSILLSKTFTALEGAVSVTAVLATLDGTSWGATNESQQTLHTWVATNSGVRKVVGRIDGIGVTDQAIAAPAILSTTTGVDGVRCCYNPATLGWVISYNIGTTVYFRTFSSTLSATSAETALSATMPSGSTASTYNLGCDEDGYFVISWPGYVARFNSSTATLNKELVLGSAAGERMFVHVQSGYIDLTRTSSSTLVVDRFLSDLTLRYSIAVATDTNLVSALHGIVSRYGDTGFIIAYLLNTTGDNVRYRAYSSTGSARYALQTVSGTGNIDASSSQGRFNLAIGELVKQLDQNHTFVIRATSTNASSGRVIALIEPTRFNPQTIKKTEIRSIADSNARFGHVVTCASPYEVRMLKPNSSTPTSMSLEVYVRQSVLMGLWRIEQSGRFFVSSVYDTDAAALAEPVYSGYPGGNKLLTPSGTLDSDYTGTTGRSGVNPDTTSFSSYWGTATAEENIFIGGPKLSQIAESFENNSSMFDPQVSTLSSELGFSNLHFFYTGRNLGWGFGTQTPEIRVTVGGTQYVLQRHVDATNSANAVDYGLIVRLPLTASDTQATRAHVYIAGLNNVGTEAAAYAFANFAQLHVGASLGILVVVRYDNTSINDDSLYDPATNGSIHTYCLSDVTTTNFEGIW